MSTYDYRCGKCNRKFTLVVSITEHDKRRPKCPECASARITQAISAFSAQRARKS
jgi:putative FmdB family regulatory protein